jgi:serine/threonine protein kinase
MIISRQYSYASDLWALGVIIYQMLSDSLPFKGKNQDETFEKIKKGVFEMPQSIKPDAQDLIKKLLVVNPELRIGV